MSALPLQCPLCAGVLQIDSAWAGQQVSCPLCRGVISVPPASALNLMVEGPAIEADLLPPLRQAAPIAPTPPREGDDLLPPRSSEQPAPSEPASNATFPPQAAEPVVNAPAVVDRLKVTQSGRRQIEVRRLSPAEKAQRRLLRNAILFGFCIIVLVVVFYFLSR